MYRTRLASGRSLRRRKSTESDDRQQVVEIVRDTTRQLADRFQLLGLSTRRLAFQQRLPQRFRLNNPIDSGAQEINVPTQKA